MNRLNYVKTMTVQKRRGLLFSMENREITGQLVNCNEPESHCLYLVHGFSYKFSKVIDFFSWSHLCKVCAGFP